MEGNVEQLNKWKNGKGFFFVVEGASYFGDGTPNFKAGERVVFNTPDLNQEIDGALKAQGVFKVKAGSDLDKKLSEPSKIPDRDLLIMKQVALKVAGELVKAQAQFADAKTVNVHSLCDNAQIMFEFLKDGV